MDSQRSLPIRLASASANPQQQIAASIEALDPPLAARPTGPTPGPQFPLNRDALSRASLAPDSSAAAAAAATAGTPNAPPTADFLAQQVGAGKEPITHQFWLKDHKVAEEIFTVSR